MLWHLLSLDAPSVATIWTLFVAWCAGVQLPWIDSLAMFTAVWMLYAADRLLDARSLSAPASGTAPELEERHRFHHRHRALFLPGLIACVLPLALLVHLLATAVLHLFALLATLLAGWLLLVHARSPGASDTYRLPKEFAVGVFFPAAIFIPTVARAPFLRLSLLPSALLLAALCSLNCLCLYAWEHPRDRSRSHASTRWSSQRIAPLGWLTVLLAAVWTALCSIPALGSWTGRSALAHPLAGPACCAVSALLLLLLHRERQYIPSLRLRALADLVLLTPLPILLLAPYRAWLH